MRRRRTAPAARGDLGCFPGIAQYGREGAEEKKAPVLGRKLKKSASSVLASFRPSTYPRGYASAPSLAAALRDSLFELPAGTIEVLAHQDSYPQSANLGQHEQFIHQRAKLEIDRAEYRLVYRRLRARE